MARELTPIDISNVPDLLRLAEEVAASGEPRVLRRASEDLAVVMPVKKRVPARRRKVRAKTEADDAAFLASAGGWADEDVDTFIKENDEQRQRSIRPPVDL